MESYHQIVFAAGEKHQIKPRFTNECKRSIICFTCSHVNHSHFNYCTSCGYPLRADSELLEMYTIRRKERIKITRKCIERIASARNFLYAGAFFCVAAAIFYSTEARPTMVRTLVMLVLGALFLGLAKWSNYKPFTSLLISFLLMVTLVAINTWSQGNRLFLQTSGWYVLVAQLGLLYFLTKGVKAAYRADILQDE